MENVSNSCLDHRKHSVGFLAPGYDDVLFRFHKTGVLSAYLIYPGKLSSLVAICSLATGVATGVATTGQR